MFNFDFLVCLFIGFITIGLARSQCPADGIHAVKIPGSCERFLRCILGNGIVQACAPGLHFDERLGQCHLPDVARCNPCANNSDNDVTFIRDQTNCARFAHCIGKSHFEKICEDGYYFDTTLNVCAKSVSVDCSESHTTSTTSTTTTTTTTACPSVRVQAIAFPGSCDRYILCGNPIVHECQPGLFFDAVLGECHARANCIE